MIHTLTVADPAPPQSDQFPQDAVYDRSRRDRERCDDDLWRTGVDQDGDGKAHPALPPDSGEYRSRAQ